MTPDSGLLFWATL